MSEAGFRVFNEVFSAAAELLYAALLTAFFRPFVPRNRRGWRLLSVFLAYIVLEAVCSRTAAPRGLFGPALALALLAASGWLGAERPFVFLLTLLYFNARISGGLMAESLYFVMERSAPLPLEPPEAVFLRAAVMVTLFLLVHGALFALMLFALRRRIMKRRVPLHAKELCYLCLVPAAGVLFGQVISRLLFEFRDGVLLRLYERHPAFLAVVPVLALLFYAGAYLAVAFQQGMEALREEQATHLAEYQQVQAIRARIHEVEGFYSQVRGFRHELRGHLTNIRGLARGGEYAELDAYITRMDESISGFELELKTGNPVTDVIVNDKRRQCADLGVDFQVDFHCPEGGFDAFDLGIILQNLLQNALEACEKVGGGERLIVLTGKRKGRFFLIEVSNPFMGDVVFGQDGLPVTTKTKDAPLHGIGLANVRREAEKYMGELELKTDGQTFSAAVLLQERSSL